MDSSIPSTTEAIKSMTSVTCKDGNKDITEPQQNNGACGSSPKDINEITTTGAVTPTNLQHSMSSTTPPSPLGHILPGSPTHHSEVPLNVSAIRIVCMSPSISITDGLGIVNFDHKPCNFVTSDGKKACQYGEEKCNFIHSAGKKYQKKQIRVVVPTLSQQPAAFSYHQEGGEGGIAIIALYDDADSNKGGMNCWAGRDSLGWNDISDEYHDMSDDDVADPDYDCEFNHIVRRLSCRYVCNIAISNS